MATARGFQQIMGLKAETTLGTAVAVNYKVPFVSDTFDQQFTHIQNAALVGSGAPLNSIQSVRHVPGGFTAYLTYDLIHPVLKHFFGNYTPVAGAGDERYVMQETLDGLGLTVAINKQVSVHEYAGFKVGEFTLTGTPADGIRYSVAGMATARSLSSVLNTSGVLAALAEPATSARFTDLTLRIGDLADALAAGDNTPVSGFSLSINRNLQQDEVNSNTLLEALESNFRQGTLTLNVPRYTTDQWKTWHDNHTVLQAELAFDNGTDPYKKVRLAQLQVVSAPTPTSGPGLLPITVTLSLHNNLNNANTQTGFTFDAEIEIVEENGS
jgi:hypothetical protein